MRLHTRLVAQYAFKVVFPLSVVNGLMTVSNRLIHQLNHSDHVHNEVTGAFRIWTLDDNVNKCLESWKISKENSGAHRNEQHSFNYYLLLLIIIDLHMLSFKESWKLFLFNCQLIRRKKFHVLAIVILCGLWIVIYSLHKNYYYIS